MAKPSAGNSDSDEPDPDDLVAIFGANLKAARMKAGLTQAQLAERSGLLQQYVSLVEIGKAERHSHDRTGARESRAPKCEHHAAPPNTTTSPNVGRSPASTRLPTQTPHTIPRRLLARR